MPITLSAVWILVGDGAGIPVDGVGLPGHFVARVDGSRPLVVDPFRGGRVLAMPECQAIVRRVSRGQLAWRDDFLDPTPIPHIVERVLRNLMVCHTRTGEDHARYRAARFVAQASPESEAAALLHARTADEIGLTPLAIRLYGEVAERFAQTPEGRWARGRREELETDAPRMH